jgi:hypothetical protein
MITRLPTLLALLLIAMLAARLIVFNGWLIVPGLESEPVLTST